MNGVELRRQVRVDANVNGHDQSDTSPTFFLRASATTHLQEITTKRSREWKWKEEKGGPRSVYAGGIGWFASTRDKEAQACPGSMKSWE